MNSTGNKFDLMDISIQQLGENISFSRFSHGKFANQGNPIH